MTVSAGRGYIGIDIGGTNLRVALVGDDGSILQRDRRPTGIDLGRESFLELLIGMIETMRAAGNAAGIETAAVGMGVPGLIANSGLVYTSVNLEPLEGVNLKEVVIAATGLSTVVVNDSNAAAFGEQRYGAGRPFASLLMLTLGTGVGSGLILNRKLWTGIDGVAGEYGHVTVEPEGLLCRCGNQGCLEQYASATALAKAGAAAVRRGGGGPLAELPLSDLNTESMAAAARQGDPLARVLFSEAGRYLGIAAASAANLLNIEALIIGGGMAASFDLFAESLVREVRRRAFAIPAERLRILPAVLGDDAGVLGGVALARELADSVERG